MKSKRLIIILAILCFLTAVYIGVTEIKYVNGHWYFFNAPPSDVQTGWVIEDGQRYFYDLYGHPVSDQMKIIDLKTYLFRSDGTVFTGEKAVGGFVYSFSGEDGAMQTGWVERGGKRYFYDAFGRKVMGRQHGADGNIYLFGADGAALEGQIQDGSNYYYFEPDLGRLYNTEREVDG
ncbi:MAG: hypothetical protein LBN36_09340, partial [Clostridiales Family XIII bacterium]|nr:hypothetical protein [Clostridiales Family XIII bacterium]